MTARLAAWLETLQQRTSALVHRLQCATHGHMYLIERTQTTIFLHCVNCQRRSPGWTCDRPTPRRHG